MPEVNTTLFWIFNAVPILLLCLAVTFLIYRVRTIAATPNPRYDVKASFAKPKTSFTNNPECGRQEPSPF